MGVNDVLTNPLILGSGQVASGATLTVNGTLALAGTTTINGAIDASGAATGDFDILLGDNLASGLDITEAANTYLRFVTTNSSEHMLASKKLRFADSQVLAFGAGDDATITHDGTTTANVAGVFEWQDNAALTFGNDADGSITFTSATPALDFTVASAALTLTTTTTGNIDITAADDINIAAAGSDIDMDAATLTVDMTGVISLDGVGASNLNIASGNLNIATTTTGSIELDGVDGVNIESSAGVLRMGADNIAQDIAIGSAGARAVTVGNAASASLVLDGGVDTVTVNADNSIDFRGAPTSFATVQNPINMDTIGDFDTTASGSLGNVIKMDLTGTATHTATTAGLIVKNYLDGETINGNYECSAILGYLKHKGTMAGGAKTSLMSLHRHSSSDQTVDYGIRLFTANSGITTLLYGSGTVANFFEAVASGDGGWTNGSDAMTKNPENDTEDGYITAIVAGNTVQIPFYNA
jgi:hypothetical protein